MKAEKLKKKWKKHLRKWQRTEVSNERYRDYMTSLTNLETEGTKRAKSSKGTLIQKSTKEWNAQKTELGQRLVALYRKSFIDYFL